MHKQYIAPPFKKTSRTVNVDLLFYWKTIYKFVDENYAGQLNVILYKQYAKCMFCVFAKPIRIEAGLDVSVNSPL